MSCRIIRRQFEPGIKARLFFVLIIFRRISDRIFVCVRFRPVHFLSVQDNKTVLNIIVDNKAYGGFLQFA